jgi:hypothetical protein
MFKERQVDARAMERSMTDLANNKGNPVKVVYQPYGPNSKGLYSAPETLIGVLGETKKYGYLEVFGPLYRSGMTVPLIGRDVSVVTVEKLPSDGELLYDNRKVLYESPLSELIELNSRLIETQRRSLAEASFGVKNASVDLFDGRINPKQLYLLNVVFPLRDQAAWYADSPADVRS